MVDRYVAPKKRKRRRRSAGPKRLVYTPEVLRSIPRWLVVEKLSTAQIAKRLETSQASLEVACSNRRISLDATRYASYLLAPKPATRSSLVEYAAARGWTLQRLIEALLDTVAKDDLYRAVLDIDEEE